MKTILTIDSAFGGMAVWVVAVAAITLLYIIWTYNWRRHQAKRAFRKIPFTEIADVKDGELVKIKGQVWAGGEVITSPLSNRKCVYYHVHVEHLVGDGRRKWWETLFDEEVMADVVLKSGDYYAVIQADSPLAHLMMDKSYETGFDGDDVLIRKYLQSHHYGMRTDWGAYRSVTCKEGVLQSGEKFAVIGRARWIPATELKFKIPAKQVLLISETKENSVVFSEDPSLVHKELYQQKQ